MTEHAWPADRRVSIRDLQAAKDRGERWAMLTGHDEFAAVRMECAGVRSILVGKLGGGEEDGYPDRLPPTMERLIPMVQAVVRGTRHALVVAEIPLGAHPSPETAFANAARFLKEGGAQAVKVAGGPSILPQVELLVQAGIPVMGSLRFTPRAVSVLRRPRREPNTGDPTQRLLADARALQASGAFSIILDSVPDALCSQVAGELKIPTIGTGAGPHCDAQILDWQDFSGMGPEQPGEHRRYSELGTLFEDAVSEFVYDVTSRRRSVDGHTR